MYRTICAELWTDPIVKTLDVPTKLLFIYLITNPHTHLCGIYYLPEHIGIRETGLKQIPYRYGIDTLSKVEKAHWDPHTETIFVVNMFAYQGQGPKNELSASKHLETLHHSCLIPKFLARYPQIPYRYPIQSCPSVPDTVPSSVPDLIPDLRSKAQTEKKLRNGAGKRPISEDDKPTEKHFEFAKSLGVELGAEWGKFKNYCKAHDKRYADFEAAFRNWLSNATGGKYAVPHVR